MIQLYNVARRRDDGRGIAGRRVSATASRKPFTAGQVFEIPHGASLTITPRLYHRFWAKEGGGVLVGGEISTISVPQDRQPLRRQRAALRADRGGRAGATSCSNIDYPQAARDRLSMGRRLDGRVAIVTGGGARHRRGDRARVRATKVRASSSPTSTRRRAQRASDALGDARGGRCALDVTREADVRDAVDATLAALRPHRHPGQQRRDHPQGLREGHDARRLWDAVRRRQPEGDVPLQQGGAAGDDRRRAAAGSSTSRRSPARSASRPRARTAPRSSA